VLVSESVRSRVTQYHLKGPKQGTSEIFIDGLPGSPDNIRSNSRGSFYISLVAPRYANKLSVVDLLGPHPFVRKFLLRLMCSVKAVLSGIQAVGSIEFVDKAQYWLGHLELAASIFPKHAIILEVDERGQIVTSLQAIGGKVAHISEITIDGNNRFAYLASPYNTEIWKIPVKAIQPASQKIPEIVLG